MGSTVLHGLPSWQLLLSAITMSHLDSVGP